MIGVPELLLGIVLGTVGVWAVHRLSVVTKTALALREGSATETTEFSAGQTVTVEGPVFADDPAPIADRLFDPEVGTVGAYLWHAWFQDTGRSTYDFDQGEFRQGRNTFASGLEVGQIGVTTGGQTLYIDLSWLEEVYDSDVLSELEVGNPMSNAKLPAVLTRYIWDGTYVSLTSTEGDCSMDRLTDVVALSRDDVAADEFAVEARGITAGQQLFIHGELRMTNGEYIIGGSDETPLLVSDTGREGLVRQLRLRALKYALALFAAVGLGALFVLQPAIT
jgi:hypothetical protein